jgi:hypothetical protein
MVRFDWELLPSSASQAISRYEVAVMSEDGLRYETLTECGGEPTATTCLVPMSRFGPAGAYRSVGASQILARVRAESALGGWGTWSITSVDYVTYSGIPRAVSMPSRETYTDNSMTVTWSFPGTDPVEYFEIWWKPYYDTQFVQLATTTEPRRQVTNVHAGKDYQFKIRARNNCGEGQFSPIATLSTPATVIVPSPPAPEPEEPCHHCGTHEEPTPPREPEPPVIPAPIPEPEELCHHCSTANASPNYTFIDPRHPDFARPTSSGAVHDPYYERYVAPFDRPTQHEPEPDLEQFTFTQPDFVPFAEPESEPYFDPHYEFTNPTSDCGGASGCNH